jgi:acyl-CoA thioester hydrolase
MPIKKTIKRGTVRCGIPMAKRLSATAGIVVRFSEVDSMSIVWHGNYAMYFEQAREAFGKKYGLDYMKIYGNGYYAPIVKLNFEYKNIIKYGDDVEVKITYIPTASAKICYEYQVFEKIKGGKKILAATGESMQVFTDLNHNLVLENPPFYELWKKRVLK